MGENSLSHDAYSSTDEDENRCHEYRQTRVIPGVYLHGTDARSDFCECASHPVLTVFGIFEVWERRFGFCSTVGEIAE